MSVVDALVDTITDAPEAEVPAACDPDATPIWDGAPMACLLSRPATAVGDSGEGGVLDADAFDEASFPDAPSDVGDDGATDATTDDSAADVLSDVASDGAIPTSYPAFTLDAPRLVSAGGPVIDKPKIVSITWNGEDDAADLETFTDKIGLSKYWNQTTCEYGVGPAVAGCENHVRMSTTLPSTYKQTDVDKFIVKYASDWAAQHWPAPSSQTIYVVFLPASVSLEMNWNGTRGDACSLGVGGYHTNTTLADGSVVSYAVIPRCDFGGGLFGTATWAASHELIEAVTDPLPGGIADFGNPAYRAFDDAHAAWALFQVGQVETGDACEYFRDSTYSDTDLGYRVQRTWSNWSIASGHSPCVPTDGSTYFNATPLDLVPLVYDMPIFVALPGPTKTKGINIPVGSVGSFHVGYYSDGPMASDWAFKAVEGNGLPGTGSTGFGGAFNNHNLVISVDNPRGHNGDKATVTVRVNGLDPQLGANLVTLVSTSGSHSHYWPVLVTSN
jgi:hypothetical protein